MGEVKTEEFQKAAGEIASFLKSRLREGSRIRVNTDSDPDGVAAGNILARCLEYYDAPFHLVFDGPPEQEDLEELNNQDYDLFVFLDQGTGQLDMIEEHLLENDRDVLILDHHPGEVQGHPGLTHLNPHQYGLDGTDDISASGVVYLVVEKVDKDFKPLSEMAILGALGDRQLKSSGFSGLNEMIVREAVDRNYLMVREGLKLDGRTLPLMESIKHSVRPFLLGLSGNENAVKELLDDVGLEHDVLLDELDRDEEKELLEGILETIEVEPKENIRDSLWGNVYTPKVKQAVGPKTINEYVTMLDACEKLDRIEVGFSALLGNEDSREEALETLREYQELMIGTLNWLLENRDRIKTTPQIRYIDVEDRLETQMIGETLSIAIESGLIDMDRPVLGLTTGEDQIKVSARARAEYAESEGVDIGKVLHGVSKDLGGSGGGHNVAAAARIPLERKDAFLKKVNRTIKDLK